MKQIRPVAALMALCLCAPVWAADTSTTNLGLTKPEVGASEDTWGEKINANADLVDAEYARTARGDANYTLLGTDRNVALTAAFTAPRTFTLPAAASLKTGKAIRIIDEAGAVTASNTLTIARAGSDTINGATSLVIKAGRTAFEIRSNGANAWSVGAISARGVGTGDPADIPDRTSADARYAIRSNDLSDLNSASTARTNLGLAIGTNVQAFDSDLACLAGAGSTGMFGRTGVGTCTVRTITGTANEVTLTNGDGIAGAPTVSLPSALTFTGKTVTGGTFNSAAFNGTVGAGTPTTGAFTSGTFDGFLRTTFSAATLASDAFTASASAYSLDTEGGAATDDLSTISGTYLAGTFLYLRTVNNTHDITVKDGVGNIQLPSDCILDTTSDLAVLVSVSTGNWVGVACNNNN